MITEKIKDNTLLIVNDSEKSKIISEIRASGLINVEFMTIEELIKQYYFVYDEKALYYLITNYHYPYDVCIKYLKNIYYINEASSYQNKKIEMLQALKNELLEKKLLDTNPLFKESLKNKTIIFYNQVTANKYTKKLMEELKKITNVEIYNKKRNHYQHQFILEFNNIEEEVEATALQIRKLLDQGVHINHIKITGITSEYHNIIKRIFKFYQLPISINNSTLYATKLAKDFLNHINKDINKTMNFLEEHYNLKDENVKTIYHSIINIVNKYAFCDDITIALPLIIHDFKNTKINQKNYSNQIEITEDLSASSEEDYIFLLSFNQGIIPQIYKDEDYLSDREKEQLCLNTTSELNQLNHEKWLEDINCCKNLTISYKKASPSGDFYLSSLNDELNLSITKYHFDYNYSHLANKIKLTSDIDNLIKYNLQSQRLSLLYSNYQEIDYMTFHNKYSQVPTEELKKYLNHKLILSYSAIDNYYHCAFKYYLSNVLKLNIYEETFHTIIGNLFHYILSICFKKQIDISKEYYTYLKKQTYQFNAKEKFFLDHLLKELIFIIDSIKEQYEYTTLTNSLYEEKIEITKSQQECKIIFKGFIDKIMLDTNQQFAAIIDYKTGNPNLDLTNTKYGLDLQLPSYIYLVKNKFPNVRIIGFYLQKILNSEITKDNKHSYETLKKDKIKLQGYTNKDEKLIQLLDSNYHESKVIKGMKTSSKGLYTKKVLDDDQIDKLYHLTEKKINTAICNILEANFNINPKRVGTNNVGCKFCQYKDICFMNEDDIINYEEGNNLEFLNDI